MGVAAAPQGLGPSAQHGSPSLLTTLRLVQKKTLWSCITGTWAPLPSYARLSRSPIPRLDGVSYWTWSAEILDDSKYGSVDRAIREVVLACLGEAGPPTITSPSPPLPRLPGDNTTYFPFCPR